MAGVKMHKVRSFLAAVVAVILAVVILSFALAVMGIEVPVLSRIPALFGVS